MLLASQCPIAESDLQSVVHGDEWQRAATMGAPTRRLEYLRARYLLRSLTGWRDALPSSKHGSPTWPPGWLGSISHKNGHVAVALSKEQALIGIGIDVEACGKIHGRLESRIVDLEESKLIDMYENVFSREDLLALVFSFKESIFKCVFPLGLKMFYFHDAKLEDIDLSRNVVRARLKMDASPQTLSGTLLEGHFQYREIDGEKYVLTSITLQF